MAKLLFLHIPKSASEPKIMFMPLGTIALAGFLSKKGHDAKIVNAFVEQSLNPGFDASIIVRQESPDFVCMPLHWHFQAYDVIEAARKLKQDFPELKIVLGGFTASFFAEEILGSFDFIDYIIKGDAQEPMLCLLEGKESPNIASKGKQASASWKLGSESLSSLCFTDFSLIKNFEAYSRLGLSENDSENKWLFVYNPGIGCNVNCSYCGGSCSSQKIISSREKAVFVNQEKAVEELKALSSHSIGIWYVCFDPDEKREYYLSLFKRIRAEGIKVKCKFEAWSLPTKEFMEEFRQAFEKGSEILISPDSGSEKVRKLNKGYFYTNDELFSTLKIMDKEGVAARLYFTAGLSGESMADFIETVKLITRIRNEFPAARIHAVPIELEPASPMFMSPEKYGIKKKRNSFMEFYNAHKAQSKVGYSTEFFSEDEIPELVNLARAASECVMKRPAFQKLMEDAPFMLEKIPISEIWGVCSICKHFRKCFG